MKIKNTLLAVFTTLTVFVYYSCDSNPCDDGYTQVKENGATFCLPDYVVGIEKSTGYGNRFFHDDYGIIEYENNKWKTNTEKDITNLLKVAY